MSGEGLAWVPISHQGQFTMAVVIKMRSCFPLPQLHHLAVCEDFRSLALETRPMDILPEYLTTCFTAQKPENGWPDLFFIITRCNPYSMGERKDDAVAIKALSEQITGAGYWYHPVDGSSPDGLHRESGFAIGGIGLEDALALGRKYLQNAIFSVTQGQLKIHGCFDGTSADLGTFEERLPPET